MSELACFEFVHHSKHEIPGYLGKQNKIVSILEYSKLMELASNKFYHQEDLLLVHLLSFLAALD